MLNLEESFREIVNSVLESNIQHIADITANATVHLMKGHKRRRDELNEKESRLEKFEQQLTETEDQLEKEREQLRVQQDDLKRRKKAIAEILAQKDALKYALTELTGNREDNKHTQRLVDKIDSLEDVVYIRDDSR